MAEVRNNEIQDIQVNKKIHPDSGIDMFFIDGISEEYIFFMLDGGGPISLCSLSSRKSYWICLIDFPFT